MMVEMASQHASSINWLALIAALAALLSALSAVIAVIVDGRRTRRQLGIQNMWKLIERWDSPELRRARVDTARHLLEDWEHRSQLPDSALELLDTFELLGYLVVRSKTLSVEDAWINFSGTAIQWWHICRSGIEQFRSVDPTLYEDYAALADLLIDLETKRRKTTRELLRPSDEDLLTFLRATARVPPEAPGREV